MKKTLKNEFGITLIALVITIVVMLILAGVTISLTLGENGIFTTAQQAAKNYAESQNKEMAVIDSFTNAVDKVASGSIYYATDSEGNKIPVPIGFSPITTSDQGTEDTGFVIRDVSVDSEGNPTDTNGNEFVWIPVGDIENYKRVAWWRDDWKYRQTLDSSTGRINRPEINAETLYFTEIMPEDEQTSVSIYGGFYIGRYEAGIQNASLSSTTNSLEEAVWTGWTGDNIKLVIQQNQQVWGWITKDKAKEVAENLYDKARDNVTSKLCSSYAWDTALKFIEKQDSSYPTNSVGGNYNIESGGTGKLQKTGYYAINNIYDMGGNANEWTTEFFSGSSSCVPRDGHQISASDIPAAHRGTYSSTSVRSHISFRVTLFL